MTSARMTAEGVLGVAPLYRADSQLKRLQLEGKSQSPANGTGDVKRMGKLIDRLNMIRDKIKNKFPIDKHGSRIFSNGRSTPGLFVTRDTHRSSQNCFTESIYRAEDAYCPSL